MEMLIIALVAIAAFAAVLLPLFRRRPGVGDESEFENIPAATGPHTNVVAPRDSGTADASGDDPIEAEVLRYRAAVRAGTVCRRCGQASPPGSAFCYECGARLPAADAKEFE